MLLDRNVAPYLVIDDEPVEIALRRITANFSGIVFVVNGEGQLVGSLTDGDFRRWLVSTQDPSLTVPCAEIANRECVSATETMPPVQVDALFTPAIELIPVLDERRRVVAVARPRTREFFLGGHHLRQDEPPLVIAEIGNNHNGSVDEARRLVDAAAAAGAQAAKFQLREMSALYRQGSAGFSGEDLGAQYTLELLAEVSIPSEELLKVLDYTREVGLIPLCTPWDEPSALILHEYGIPGFKVASADLTNHGLLEMLGELGRPMLVSTGMSTEEEIVEAVGLLQQSPSPFALLHCNSAYPSPMKDINLRYLPRLAEIGDCLVGYSGHERGFAIPVAAVAMGAVVIEKHLTLDRTSRGNDHKVSLEPDEFAAMVAAIADVTAAMGSAGVRQPTQGEQLNRLSLAKSLVAARDLPAGHVIADEDLAVRSPGRGLQPNARSRVVGRTTPRPIAAGDFIYPSDIEGTAGPRALAFDRPWGLPVRFHDVAALTTAADPDFVEFHLSYRDMEIAPDEAVPQPMNRGLAVHSPDLFAGDHLLDLAADDDAVRERSIADLQRVVDLTRALKPKFTSARPIVIVSVGGASTHAPIPRSERPRLYQRCADALARIDAEGVEITAQTLPPYPWHVGGQRFWNLFVDPAEIVAFHEATGVRVTFDVSHTKLACTDAGTSFAEAAEMLLPITAHLHLADAAGVDGEGLQVGEGEIDWFVLAEQLRRLAPGVGFIPEIWQGHAGGGHGFWVALDRLERLTPLRP